MARIDMDVSSTQVGEGYGGTAERTQPTSVLLRELVAHLRENRTQLREEWARRITEAQLLTAMTKDEIFAEATSVYDKLRGGPGDGHLRSLAGLRSQLVRAHHSARRGNARSGRDCSTASRRFSAFTVCQVPGRLYQAEPHPGCV